MTRLNIFSFLFSAILFFGCSPEMIYVNELSDHSHDLALKMSMKIAQEKTGAEFALVQIYALQSDQTIKQTAVELVQRLDIGAKHGGRGVLILYSEKEKQIKIEVTYALEGVLPDVLIHRLEEAAQTYFLSQIPQDYFSELLITLSNTIHEKQIPEELEGNRWTGKWLSGGAGVRAAVASQDPAQILKFVRTLDFTASQEFLPGASPQESLDLYLKSLEEGIGEPKLPLLTEGSKIFRVVVPRSVAQQKRIAHDYRRAGLLRLIRRADMALAVFGLHSSTLPIVLVKDRSGRWMVDEVKSWTYFHRFENSTEFFLLTDDNPFRDELLRMKHPTALCTVFKKRFSLPRIPSSADDRSLSNGDQSIFEFGWFARAKATLQNQLKQDPTDTASRWKLYHVLTNLSEMDAALRELEILFQESPSSDRELRMWRYSFRAAYREAEAMAADPLKALLLRGWNVLEGLWKIPGDLFYKKDFNPCI